MTHSRLIALIVLAGLLASTGRAERFVPDGRLQPDNVNVLMACDAERSPDLREFQANSHGKFHVTGWRRPDQHATWTVQSPGAGSYDASVIWRRKTASPLRAELSAGGTTATGLLAASHWQRVPLQGRLSLPAEPSRITLRIFAEEASAPIDAEIFSVELVRPPVRAEMERAAAGQRADTAWMRKAGYGFMVHWTSQSCPREGKPKPYADAVRDFDVENFAEQMKEGGAGFVVFTTSHAYQYFPAPLASLDRLLPGRTASRDLVGELAKALEARGIRLMLYYHLGSAADAAWMNASGFWKTDTSQFFANWADIVTEAGQRYGAQLAGWWFDDGAISYYYRSPDWRTLTAAARAGSPSRVVGFNPWEYPSPTPFQDFYCGEGNTQPNGDGTLEPDGHGILGPGRYPGLQACATLITERDWGHFVRDREIGPPRWNAGELRAILDAFARHGNVPIFNLEIYQEGRVSSSTIELFRQAQGREAQR
jgi:hypothetical protein